ncbi:MAG: LysR family transcriptional regulator [Pseudomonadota bacterium]
MARLNYHHLRYFWEVAHEGNLTRTAQRLNISQSALSTQIRNLEEWIGSALFDREGRRLVLTEAGRLALDHADRIFQAGDELLTALGPGGGPARPLKVGALSTLSRNFQLQFLRPILSQGAGLSLVSGNSETLLEKLRALALDMVLSTEPPPRAAFPELIAHRIAEQPVGLFGVADRMGHATLADLLRAEPVILPTESSIRTGFDSLAARLGVTVKVAAEVDDMAMVRLLAREGAGLAAVPPVVLADEIAAGLLLEAPFALDISETFYAIISKRSYQHPLLAQLFDLGREAEEPAH